MSKTGRDLLEAARGDVPEITAEEVKSAIDSGADVALIDVREPDEFRGGYLPGAEHVSRGFLELKIEQVVPDRTTPIVAYCAGGVRSLLAGQVLQSMGYQNVKSMAGGYGKWKDLAFPVQVDKQMNAEQLNRYSRHFLLSQIGEKGQSKLLDAKVVLIGAGGLGSPTGLYLTAMGVGNIRHRGPGRGGHEQLTAPDRPHQRSRGHLQGGKRKSHPYRAEPGREHHLARGED